MSAVLVIEDEPAILESLGYVLERDGQRTLLVSSLQAAREALAQHSISLAIVDLMLPDGSGFDLIRELRQQGSSQPALIVLSSRDQELDRIRALEMGADDYVTKPFSPREVVARVHAVLRRAPAKGRDGPKPEERSLYPKLNTVSRRVSVAGQELDLTRVEFDLLALFISDPGRAFSRSEIIDRIWGSGFALSDRTIDSHIKALRKKIEGAGGHSSFIETVRGIGYRSLEPDEPT